MRILRAAVLMYGLLNAVLYSGLLPLWEGFDEIFHYGNVQYLATAHSFPVRDQTTVSREIWESLDLTPVSHYLQPFTHAPTNFSDYFALPEQERIARRRALDTPKPAARLEPSTRPNYEAQQAPLAYLALTPAEWLLAGKPLPTRIFALRFRIVILTVFLMFFGVRALARRLEIAPIHEITALFLVFSSQMFYATTCHISNDWPVAPWLLFFLCAAIDCAELPTLRRSVILGVWLGVGLLLKASLLVFVPLALGVVLYRFHRRNALVFCGAAGVLAAPWYIRNMLLYGNLTATTESTSGVGPRQLLDAAIHLPWIDSILTMARTSLWTGNNSFTSFGHVSVDLILILLAIALVLYGRGSLRRPAEIITLSAIGLYCVGLLFITLAFFYSTKGGAIAAVPWYMQALLAPVLLLASLGLARSRILRVATVLLWTYVLCATWLAKLIPLYGGYSEPRARFSALVDWYVHHAAERGSILATLCPAPVGLIYALVGAVLALGVTICGVLIWKPTIKGT